MWKDNLRPGSFRGAPFFIDLADDNVGRRHHRHEYPQRDLPWLEDLGRRAREYFIEAFVIGDDYMDARDALIAAVEQEGPGTLVHPYYGEVEVVCDETRVTQRAADGGMAIFALRFVEAGDRRFPSASVETGQVVDTRASSAASAAIADFTARFDVNDLPEAVAEAAAALVDVLVADVDVQIARVVMSAESATILDEARTALAVGKTNAVRDAATLADLAADLIAALGTGAAAPRDGYKAMVHVAGYGGDLAPVSTASRVRRRRADNQIAFRDLARRLATVEAARATAAMAYDSYDDAIAVRDEISDLLDREILAAGDAGNDPAWAALTDLMAAVVADISARGGRLARVIEVLLNASLPALAVAYDHYENATRDGEIAARNRLIHPGFVPPAIPLEVLAQ